VTEGLDRDAIERLLPHRDPFLLVDSVDELEPGRRGRGSLEIREDMFWVSGHFPGNPIMPGVLITEAMAQVAGVVAVSGLPEHAGQDLFLVGADRLRFRRPVRPGDVLVVEAEIVDVRRGLWTFEVSASVGEERVASGKLLAALAPTS
jgi:3-hydroxyacyl-[acyl-carrier-protein] dehydratase